MTQAQIAKRKRVVAAAIGSVRAEGLAPSADTKKLLMDYAEGKITAEILHKTVLNQVQKLN